MHPTWAGDLFHYRGGGLGQGARTSILSAGLLKKEPVVQP